MARWKVKNSERNAGKCPARRLTLKEPPMSAEIQHEIDEQRAAERRRAYVNRDLPLLADYDDGFDLGWDNPPTPPPGGPR